MVEVGRLRVAYREEVGVAPTWNLGKDGQGQTVPDKESRECEEGKVRMGWGRPRPLQAIGNPCG